jgi:hypothetical protein
MGYSMFWGSRGYPALSRQYELDLLFAREVGWIVGSFMGDSGWRIGPQRLWAVSYFARYSE